MAVHFSFLYDDGEANDIEKNGSHESSSVSALIAGYPAGYREIMGQD